MEKYLITEKGRQCIVCKDFKSWNDFSVKNKKAKTLTGQRHNRCKNCHSKYVSDWGKKLKEKILNYYGGCCECCGESDIRFLTLDHKNNDGAAHRNEIAKQRNWQLTTSCPGGAAFYRWVEENNYPNDLQVLCWNCNCGRQHNKGICPHQDL